MSRFVAKLASECQPDAIVIPLPDEADATEVAMRMNGGSKYHLTYNWARGPANEYVFEDHVSWVVLDTEPAKEASS